MASGPTVYGLNVSHLFDKEMLMYSFGDIKLKKPISVKKIGFIMAALFIWTGPLLLIFGTPPQIWMWGIWLVPPFFIGHYATKPVFGGKGLFDWIATQINFIQQPRGWSDFNVDNDQEDTVYYIEQEISISRRREIDYLTNLARSRDKENKKKQKRPAPIAQKQAKPKKTKKSKPTKKNK